MLVLMGRNTLDDGIGEHRGDLSADRRSAFRQQRDKALESAVARAFYESNSQFDVSAWRGWMLAALDGADIRICRDPQTGEMGWDACDGGRVPAVCAWPPCSA